MNTATDTLEINVAKTTGGVTHGQSSTDLVGFYGATPIAQPASASQAAISSIVDGSTGGANYSSGIAAITATFNSAIVASCIATLAQNNNNLRTLVHQLRAELVSLGLIAGA